LRAGSENKLGSVQALCAAPPVALVAIFFYRHRFFNVRHHVENHVFAQVKALMDGGAQGDAANQPATPRSLP
jgi:hypothetical protein